MKVRQAAIAITTTATTTTTNHHNSNSKNDENEETVVFFFQENFIALGFGGHIYNYAGSLERYQFDLVQKSHKK